MDKTTYRVLFAGDEIETYSTEAAAVAEAKACAAESVVMVVESGEYRSLTHVWPTLGQTRSN